MATKKEIMVKVGAVVMAIANAVPTAGSFPWIGEPQLPKKLQK